MPSYTPGLTYIAAVFDGILLKIRLGDETTDEALVGVCVGSPEGQIVGSPGDIRIEIPGEVGGPVGLWQKETGELTAFGWVPISASAVQPAINTLQNEPFVTWAATATLPNDRVVTAGTNITLDLTTPGQIIVNAAAGGGGNTLQVAITNQGAVPTTQGFSTRIQFNDTFGWEFEDQAGNDVVTISADGGATAFTAQGGNTAAGAGQAISIAGGNATVAGQNGGSITETAGTGNGAGAGGSMVLFAGAGGATGPGGSAVLRGGAGGATSGNAGSATVAGGIPVDGNGGNATLAASSGVGTNRDGGDTLVTAGAATGNATGGSMAIIAGGGGVSGTAGPLAITGGAAGSASGDSGSIAISTQPSVAGATGSITLTTGNATGGAAGDLVLRGGTGTTTNGRVLVQPVWAGDAQMLALVGNGANSATAGLHSGSRNPNGLVSSNPGSFYMQNTGTSGAAYINTSLADPGTVWSQIATTSAVTLQLAITNQSTTPTTQNFDTTIGLTGGAAWIFVDNTAAALLTIDDGAVTGVAITGRQVTATGAGQDVSISGGAATGVNQDGGDSILSGGAPNGSGAAGMVRISSAWALDATISPAALSAGNNNNYAPTNGATSNTWRLTPNAAGSTITGITAGQAGRKLELFNLSTGTVIVLTHDDTGNSTAANCFFLPNATSVTIPPLGSLTLWYDTTSSRWRTDSVAGNAVTLQNAINGQGTTPTEQSITTSIDLNGGAAWSFRDNGNAALVTITDGIGCDVQQQFRRSGDENITLGAGTTNDQTIAASTSVVRMTPNAAGSTLTGMTGGADGRVVTIFNISTTASITLSHDTGSANANRFFLPNASSVTIPPLSGIEFIYDSTSTRWRPNGAAGASASPGTTQVQDFTNTAGGTFDVAAAIAAGFTFAHVIVIGAGGGGGGGGSSTTPGGGNTTGGTGGGGGCRYEQTFRLSELASTIAITVGAGGTGGNGGSNGAGSNGNPGGNSSFGTHLVAGGGGGGWGSTVNNGGSGGTGGGLGSAGIVGLQGTAQLQGGGGPGTAVTTAATNAVVGSASGGKGGGSNTGAVLSGGAEWGGAAGGNSTNAATVAGCSSWWGGAGGGVGGGHTTLSAAIAGSAGGSQRAIVAGGGAAPGTTGAVPTAGDPGTNGNFTTPGSAGGGGGGAATAAGNVAGARGGDGGTYGNGGGGGGGTAGNGAGAPQTGGRGGDGAQGAVRVVLS